MSKQNIRLILICVGVVVAMVIGVCALTLALVPKTYSSAKEMCEQVLENNESKMTDVAIAALESGKDESGEFQKYSYNTSQREKTVTFEIGSQGMLGGQYWELVYTKDGTFYGVTDTYLYKGVAGNNIMKAERLDEHWWFLWTDYDGKTLS